MSIERQLYGIQIWLVCHWHTAACISWSLKWIKYIISGEFGIIYHWYSVKDDNKLFKCICIASHRYKSQCLLTWEYAINSTHSDKLSWSNMAVCFCYEWQCHLSLQDFVLTITLASSKKLFYPVGLYYNDYVFDHVYITSVLYYIAYRIVILATFGELIMLHSSKPITKTKLMLRPDGILREVISLSNWVFIFVPWLKRLVLF